jgi:hypothetical protein
MILRTTQKESGTPQDSTQPLPIAPPALEPRSGPEADEPDAPAASEELAVPTEAPTPTPSSQPASRVADRKAQRAARRQRRRVAIICAVVVAVSLVLTILIVDMARTRTSGNQTDLSLSTSTPKSHVITRTPVEATQTRGAPASEGGNR